MSFQHKIFALDGITEVTQVAAGATVLHTVTVRNEGFRGSQHYVFRSNPDDGLEYLDEKDGVWVVRGRHLEVDPDYLTNEDSPATDILTRELKHTDQKHAGRHVIDVEFTYAPQDQAAFPPPQLLRKTLTCV